MAKKNKTGTHTSPIFSSGQDKMFEKSYEQELEEERSRKVECLGMTFENDAARREYFLEKLKEKLKDPEFRKIEGFPVGRDEDILALSDPPYYTACPNPFIGDFIKEWEREKKTEAIKQWLASKSVGQAFQPAIQYPELRQFTKQDLDVVRQYQRRLPHWELEGSTYFITFRVATGVAGQAFQPAIPPHAAHLASVVEEAIWYHHGDRYFLDAYVIMPDHVHLLLRLTQGNTLAKIMQGLKGYTARELNKVLGRNGPFWQNESFDHLIRNEADWLDKFDYIHNNPVKAGLVDRPQDYPFSSLVVLHSVGRIESGRLESLPHNKEAVYHREPFAADVSEGKNDPIYNAHSYHTKVPHKAIMRYILHYTEPGDIVFDGFCGTGMTGVAAQLCGDNATVESLGYKVQKDGTILDENGKPISKLGARKAILNDLSPAATFIAYNYNTPVDVRAFEREAKRILKEVEDECGWMYKTVASERVSSSELEAITTSIKASRNIEELKSILKTHNSKLGTINYTVWSDVFVCPECTREVVFWEAAVDKEEGKVHDEFPCPHCKAMLTKRRMDRAWVTKFDKAINQTIRQAKQVPVLINYSIAKKRFEKSPDSFDLALIDKIENSDIPYWFPNDKMPEGYNTEQPKVSHGITHVHHFYTRRNLWVLGAIIRRYLGYQQLQLLFNSQLVNISKMNRYRPGVSFPYNPLSGTLYVASQVTESNIFTAYLNKITKLIAAYMEIKGRNPITTHSSTKINFQYHSTDYIFTDPPFGGNLMYSELNFLWEAWLRVFTNNKPEAIQNKVQGKGLLEYQALMTRCFHEYYRVLKPGRWMTVEFHNSKNSVWNSIQESLQHAGFVIADVRTLDKKQGTFKQVTSGGAVKQDLVISAYKPNGGLEERFKLEAGTEDGVWDFARTHLRQLPVFVSKDGQAETIAERQNFLLFDRMIAFHVQRGVTIPISAAEFYAGLTQRFSERDGMFFLPEQVTEYDKKRMTVKEILQLELYVKDEATAIQWLKQQLTIKPQTFQELHPQFMKEIGGWQKHEKPLELSQLLDDTFICYDGKGEVPSQIHSYLSTNFKDMRNLPKNAPELRTKGKDRWYVPDPNKAGDMEKKREKALLKEFEDYRTSSQKRLKVFRLEAVRAGFKKAWQERDYKTIIAVAQKIPEDILQEDPKLLMWYDQALTRTGGEV